MTADQLHLLGELLATHAIREEDFVFEYNKRMDKKIGAASVILMSDGSYGLYLKALRPPKEIKITFMGEDDG